ncbi:hypothetical protein D3C71_1305970 [compost metagenome]
MSRRISPPHSLGTLRVMMLITPPMASEPYSDDIGPRTTSMRSMAASGGVQPPSTPAESELVRVSRELWRLPSIRISVYCGPMPRRLMSWRSPPPVMMTPGTSSKASFTSR